MLVQAKKLSAFRSSAIQWLTEYRGAANQTFNNLTNYLFHYEVFTQVLVNFDFLRKLRKLSKLMNDYDK